MCGWTEDRSRFRSTQYLVKTNKRNIWSGNVYIIVDGSIYSWLQRRHCPRRFQNGTSPVHHPLLHRRQQPDRMSLSWMCNLFSLESHQHLFRCTSALKTILKSWNMHNTLFIFLRLLFSLTSVVGLASISSLNCAMVAEPPIASWIDRIEVDARFVNGHSTVHLCMVAIRVEHGSISPCIIIGPVERDAQVDVVPHTCTHSCKTNAEYFLIFSIWRCYYNQIESTVIAYYWNPGWWEYDSFRFLSMSWRWQV